MYLEKLKLDGRIAVVTGGGRGIGLACATALAEAGARILIADIDAGVAEEGRDAMKAAGYEVDTTVLDVTRPDEVTRCADDLVAKRGRVDILVANAGIARSGTPAEEVTDEHWLNVNDVNYNGVFWCDRAFGRHMLNARKGAIVNIGSMSGFIVNRPQKQAYYNASKAAVHHLTRSLATEWADRNVRVNAVAPTYINTPLTKFGGEAMKAMQADWLRDTPMGRMGEPDEIASVVHFLASDAASLMTGSIVLADAGFSAW
ncbi:SDR family NAD(P)-dependent oxidoreductase [Marinivivus vitaminiproducens]|uniref:SDR family NAD(P)-dependent oxidoreductase n=1 Tax=Marinivivus vitaminiproducens TaxID=3035935 RepID=UPI0027AAC62B|nr:SDR family oxidoreductase [Geminicoccaceae bacterium SCSIO 64248]